MTVLDDRDVGEQRGSPVDALEEVVAQERVLGHTARQAPFERADVI